MTTRIYVDETKAKGYLVAAVTGNQAHLKAVRKQLGDLVLPGQRGLHMKNERDQRRRQIADTIIQLGEAADLNAVVYDAGRAGTEKDRRARCLKALVHDASGLDDVVITFDRDESLINWDRQRMIELTRASNCRDRITYGHLTRQTEILLAIPDAIAWCWARGGQWRARIQPMVANVIPA